MKARVRNMGHVAIVVRDVDRSVSFYTDMLGMRLTEGLEEPTDEVGHGVTAAAAAYVRCDGSHHTISIFRLSEGLLPEDAPDASVLRIGFHHMAFELATPDDLVAKYCEMRDAGVPIVQCRKGGPGNHPRFYARDPDGHLLEFYWGIDEVGWDGLARGYEPIQEIDLEAFDFEGYVAAREAAGARVQAVAASTAAEVTPS